MKAEQYLIKHNLDKTYWGKKIIAAERRGRFTESNVCQSDDWKTCACGKQDSRLHNRHGHPNDDLLFNYGVDFCDHVESHKFYSAAVTLNKIEKRAAVVLRSVA